MSDCGNKGAGKRERGGEREREREGRGGSHFPLTRAEYITVYVLGERVWTHDVLVSYAC